MYSQIVLPVMLLDSSNLILVAQRRATRCSSHVAKSALTIVDEHPHTGRWLDSHLLGHQKF